MLSEEQIDYSILARIGNAIAWIFTPLGWGNWQAAVASITGLVAKENIVGTMGILYGAGEGTVYSTWPPRSPASPATPSWPSTCCALPASPPSARSSAR
ncbi:MAG: nucleoside recognition domain-containing protein [Christensenellales bacterium]